MKKSKNGLILYQNQTITRIVKRLGVFQMVAISVDRKLVVYVGDARLAKWRSRRDAQGASPTKDCKHEMKHA